MLRQLLIVGLAVLVTSCVPIPQEPPKTETSPQVSPNDNACFEDQLLMLPGQSVEGPISDELPDYVDIVGVSSELDGEILTATFHLRAIPEELDLSTEDAKVNRAEYTLVVFVSLEYAPDDEFPRTDYVLGAVFGWERPTNSVRQYTLLLGLNRLVPTPYSTKQEFSNAL